MRARVFYHRFVEAERRHVPRPCFACRLRRAQNTKQKLIYRSGVALTARDRLRNSEIAEGRRVSPCGGHVAHPDPLSAARE